MKTYRISLILVIVTAAVFIAGCVSQLPVVSTLPNGQVVTNSTYVVSPTLAANQDKVNQIAGYAAGAASLTPYTAPFAGFIQPLALGIMGLITAASGLLAQYKNKQAAANAAAAAALASAVVAAPPPASGPTAAQQAITAGNSNGSTGLVAKHLENAKSPV